MFDKIKLALFTALVMLPLSAILIHGHVHPDIEWVYWFTLFDVIAITGLYLYPPTRTFAFWLNTVFGLAGIFYHATFSFMGTLADSMIILADVAVGYVLYVYLVNKEGIIFRPKRTTRRVKRRKK